MESYSASWSSPSNIALVKYWGKRPVQLPATPSLSLTLSKAMTETEVRFIPGKQGAFSLTINGEVLPSFDEKVRSFLGRVSQEMDFLDFGFFEITSRNTFPHSAGIASSASGMSALALCLCSIEEQMRGHEPGDGFFVKASRLARLGSGSACRSVFAPFAIWGSHIDLPGSHDEYALGLDEEAIHPVFRDYHDAILVLDAGQKAVSSSQGHSLMEAHPYLQGRKAQAEENMASLLAAIKAGDLDRFIEVVEEEALSLHALMMSSRPGFTLMAPATLKIIGKIRNFRRDSGWHPAFTLDAGPNVHLLYPAQEREAILAFIESELLPYCQDGNWIDDKAGSGPEPLNQKK